MFLLTIEVPFVKIVEANVTCWELSLKKISVKQDAKVMVTTTSEQFCICNFALEHDVFGPTDTDHSIQTLKTSNYYHCHGAISEARQHNTAESCPFMYTSFIYPKYILNFLLLPIYNSCNE